MRTNYMRRWKGTAAVLLCTIAAVSVMSGCSKTTESAKGSHSATEATEETDAPIVLDLSYYLTGCDTYTTEDGTKTSIRFLIENMDKNNLDWVKGIDGKERLKAGNEEVKVYSQYINDHCRYVDGTIPGAFKAEDITYSVGEYSNKEWIPAGEEQYKEISAISESGNLYFYNGCGNSTGLSGDRVLCVWLAGFTSDTIMEDGKHPLMESTDNFSLVTADGEPLANVTGAAGEPELIANEFGIEAVIQAADESALYASLEQTGLLLRHTSDSGVITDFTLVEKIEMPEDPEAVIGTDSNTDNDQEGSLVDSGSSEEGQKESKEDETEAEASSQKDAIPLKESEG